MKRYLEPYLQHIDYDEKIDFTIKNIRRDYAKKYLPYTRRNVHNYTSVYPDYIYCVLARKQYPYISQDLLNELEVRYDLLMTHHEKVVSSRYSRLPMDFVIHKLLEILGRPDLTQWFPLTQSEPKMQENERIWTHFCEILDWPFIDSKKFDAAYKIQKYIRKLHDKKSWKL